MKAISILILFASFSLQAYVEECSLTQFQLGCKTSVREHCYPKADLCTVVVRCSCPHKGFSLPLDSNSIESLQNQDLEELQ